MFTHLSIKNYALIHELEIELNKGLTIITGETGAGKSILLGALAMLVGERADSQALNDKNQKCIIEGKFDVSKYNLKTFFNDNELDYEAETIIRREISPEGKSRAFINDTPINLSVLKQLGEKLIDIHSQHETLNINSTQFQLDVIDSLCDHETLLIDYQKEFKQFKQFERDLENLKAQAAKGNQELDYFQFQFNELEEAGLRSGEQELMEAELETLSNSEEIKQNLSQSYNALSGGEQNLLASLAEVKQLLNSISKYNPDVKKLHERIGSSYIELKDIATELTNLEEDIIYNPKRIEELNERLDNLYRLQKKHNVQTIDELITIKNEFEGKLSTITNLDNDIVKLSGQITDIKRTLLAKAQKLSADRTKAADALVKDVKNLLGQMGMPNAVLQIKQDVLSGGEFNATGIDKLEFLFSANKGSDFKELNKVASGGELSRLMLSIKSLVAKQSSLPTIIFDEIDTGVSGEVADKVGGIMEQMGKNMQVITITHLPQIASKGNAHLFVYKKDEKTKTLTHIKALSKEERVMEVAKMLSTANPTDAAIKNAKELLKA